MAQRRRLLMTRLAASTHRRVAWPDGVVRRHVETLALMGEVREELGGRYLAAGAMV